MSTNQSDDTAQEEEEEGRPAGAQSPEQKRLCSRLVGFLRDHGYQQGPNYNRACEAALVAVAVDISDEELEEWMVSWLDSQNIRH